MQNQNDICKDATNVAESQVSNLISHVDPGDDSRCQEPRSDDGESKVQSPISKAGQVKEWRGSGLEFAEVEPWPEAVDAAALLDQLERTMTRFVVLPKYAAETLALWTLHTYAFQLREVSTYLGIESPEKRCGKTTLLSLLSELVQRPVASANISSSALFRVIEETEPTLLIDEADTFLRGNDELRGILNSGYTRKTAYVVRVANERKSKDQSAISKESNDHSLLSKESDVQSPASNGSRLVRFSCWCPKVMAAIGRLPETLVDRCIVIRMQRKTAGEECERLRFLEPTPFKRKCARLVRDRAAEIASMRPTLPGSLNDRAGDIWEPLLVLADLAGGAWPEKARTAAVALSMNAQESSPIAALFQDILLCFTGWKTDRMFSRDLVGCLNRAGNRPWAELRNGKPITEQWLAHQLRPYGIRPQNIWVDEVQAKGYMDGDFNEMFRRYLPSFEVEARKGRVDEAVENINPP